MKTYAIRTGEWVEIRNTTKPIIKRIATGKMGRRILRYTIYLGGEPLFVLTYRRYMIEVRKRYGLQMVGKDGITQLPHSAVDILIRCKKNAED